MHTSTARRIAMLDTASCSEAALALPECMIKREPLPDLQQQFGQIDICLFDQLLRGQIRPGMRVLPMRLPHASVVAGKVAPALGWLQADIVFMDPPYEMEGE